MRFRHDRRGQSVVIGTVILFGFLILALSLYQVQVVPQQNAQTEFEHFEEVQNDLVELRAGILQAGSIDQPQYQTVRLGTTYSTRIFAINPPDPAGTIRTTESYNITIEGSGESVNVSTRFIQYRPGYNEIDQSPTWYDASVLYVDARDEGGGIAVIEDQELVTGDGEVRIVALQNEFRRSGTGQVTLELRPADNVTETLPEGNLTVTVPTRLSENDWENKTDIPTDSDIYGGVTDDTNDDGIYNLTLNTTAENLTLDTVGVGEAPDDPTQNDNGAVGGDPSPTGNEPELRYVAGSGVDADNNGRITFELKNIGTADAEITEISVDSTNDNKATRVNNENNPEFSGAGGELNTQSDFLEINVASRTDLDTNAEIAQGSTETFSLQQFRDDNGNSVNMNKNDVTLTFWLDNGSIHTITIEDIS